MKVIDLRRVSESKVIKETVEVLRNGGVVVYPTETCYGIGVVVSDGRAVEKVFEFKGRRRDKPISMAVADQKMAEKYVEINETARNLYTNFLPGPLTVVSKSRGRVVLALEAGSNTLGIRIPHYPLILEIIKKLGEPITATSANQSGKKNPYSLRDWRKYTSLTKQELVDLFLDAGKLPERAVSTVVDTTVNELAILRQGEIEIGEGRGLGFVSGSEEETQKIGGEILQKFKERPLVLALQGELGVGKTQFAKGVAKALGVEGNINSPSFVLVKEYQGKRGKLFHLDTWRLEKGEEVLDLGLKKMLTSNNVMVIEWLQKVRGILEKIKREEKAKVVWVVMEVISERERRIRYRL
jgi:L-threonylcarbamoyladenylate synthase